MATHHQDTNLTTSTTNVTASFSPVVGDFLIVTLIHDNTTNVRNITWDSVFRFADTVIDQITANSNDAYTFFGRTDPIDSVVRWFLVGMPILGAL